MKLASVTVSLFLSGVSLAALTTNSTGILPTVTATATSSSASLLTTAPPFGKSPRKLTGATGEALYHPTPGVSVPIEWSVLFRFSDINIYGEAIISIWDNGYIAHLDHFRGTGSGCPYMAVACGMRDSDGYGLMFTYAGQLAGNATCSSSAPGPLEAFSDIEKYDGNVPSLWPAIIKAKPRMYCYAAVDTADFDIRPIVKIVEKQVENAEGPMFGGFLYH